MLKIFLLPIVYFTAVILPVFFWLSYFRKKDQNEPEPKKLILWAFLLGVLATELAGYGENFISVSFFPEFSRQTAEIGMAAAIEKVPQYLGTAIFLAVLAGPIEELLKFLLLYFAVYRKKDFNQMADGVIYGVAVALGFSLVENTGYFWQIYADSALTPDFFFTVAFRGVVTTFLHLTATGLSGFYLGKAKFAGKNRKRIALTGLFWASLLHASYNFFISFYFGDVVTFILILAALFHIVREMRKTEAQMVHVV